MERSHKLGLAVLCLGLVLPAARSQADVLILRDGNQVEGELVSVQGETIEFRERGRIRRVDRSDVRRIELDDARGGRDRDRGRDRNRDSDWERAGDRDRDSGGAFGKDVASRRTGLREQQLVVAANAPWTETNIQVRAGQTIYVSSSGKISWGPGRSDDAGGEGGRHANPGRPLPNRPGAALIGKVGAQSRDIFFIGNNSGPITMRTSGQLLLGINDDYLQDNTGGFRVTVNY
jgi:hypothetical protein